MSDYLAVARSPTCLYVHEINPSAAQFQHHRLFLDNSHLLVRLHRNTIIANNTPPHSSSSRPRQFSLTTSKQQSGAKDSSSQAESGWVSTSPVTRLSPSFLSIPDSAGSSSCVHLRLLLLCPSFLSPPLSHTFSLDLPRLRSLRVPQPRPIHPPDQSHHLAPYRNKHTPPQ